MADIQKSNLRQITISSEEHLDDNVLYIFIFPRLLYILNIDSELTRDNVIGEELIREGKIITTNIELHTINIIYTDAYKPRGQPFIDVSIFEGPIEILYINTPPIMVVEITKNDVGDSGNSVQYQRLEKFTYLNNKYGHEQYKNIHKFMLYTICIRNNKKLSTPWHISLNIHKILGIEVYQMLMCEEFELKHCTGPLEEITDIPKLQVLVNSTRKTGGQPNRMYYNPIYNIVRIECNLLHKKTDRNSSIHDPNTGFICGLIYALKSIMSTCKIQIINNNLYPKQLSSGAKLWSCLYPYREDIELYDREDKLFDRDWGDMKVDTDPYCKISQGEKLASIQLEDRLIACGFKTVFSNHGGCELSFIQLDRQYYRHKRRKDDKREKQKKEGIPDLVMMRDKLILIIEGKTIKYINAGIEQVKEEAWIKKNILQRESHIDYYKEGYKIVKCVCTYGGTEHPKNPNFNEEVSLLYSLLDNGDYYLNKDLIQNEDPVKECRQEPEPEPEQAVILQEHSPEPEGDMSGNYSAPPEHEVSEDTHNTDIYSGGNGSGTELDISSL